MSRRRTQGRTKPHKKRNAKVDRAEREAAEQAREVTQRAIRRLNVLEWVVWGAGALMAMAGGALVAWVMGATVGWNVRQTWIVASMLLFVIPGGAAIIQIRKNERAEKTRAKNWISNDG